MVNALATVIEASGHAIDTVAEAMLCVLGMLERMGYRRQVLRAGRTMY